MLTQCWANVAYGAQHQNSIGPTFGACRVRPQCMGTYVVEGWREIIYALVLVKPYSASLFSPGEVRDCTQHWQVSPGAKEPGLLNHIETAVWTTMCTYLPVFRLLSRPTRQTQDVESSVVYCGSTLNQQYRSTSCVLGYSWRLIVAKLWIHVIKRFACILRCQ